MTIAVSQSLHQRVQLYTQRAGSCRARRVTSMAGHGRFFVGGSESIAQSRFPGPHPWC